MTLPMRPTRMPDRMLTMPSIPRLKFLAVAIVTAAATMALPEQALAIARCEWSMGTGPLLYTADLGTFWVPRDAEIGTKIASLNRLPILQQPGVQLICDNDGSRLLTATVNTPRPIEPGTLPPVDGKDVTGKVLRTSIPGVGLYVELGIPFNGHANNHFKPTDGKGAVPFVSEHQEHMRPSYLIVNHMVVNYVALIKTGTIAPGLQAFNDEVARATMSDVGDAARLTLRGQVQQAQCTLKADAVSANPVQLGTQDIAQFRGVGTTTAPVDFHITLSDCEDDPNGSVARAFMRLDGVNGSAALDRDRGLFSLTSDSTATGLGIQVLRSDNTPVKLEEFVDMAALTPGNVRLDLRAQYYQTNNRVTPGLAKGALNFTINYR